MASLRRLGFGNPLAPFATASPPAYNNVALDASTDKVGWIFLAADGETITKLGCRVNATTGTIPTYRISLQGVNLSTGMPDGTVKGASNDAYATFSSVTTSAFNYFTMTGSYTPSGVELLALVVEYSSGTINGSNFMSVSSDLDMMSTRINFPKAVVDTTGSWANRALMPIYAYQTASRTYGTPIASVTATTYSSDSSPNERALRFTLPAAMSDTHKIAGVRFIATSPAANKSIKVAIYSGTTELDAYTIDGDLSTATGSGYRSWSLLFSQATLDTLSFGTTYRIGFAPQETSANFVLPTITVTTAAELDAFPGSNDWAMSHRAGGAWTDVDTERPFVEPLWDDVTEPAGGGTTGIAALVGGGLVGR